MYSLLIIFNMSITVHIHWRNEINVSRVNTSNKHKGKTQIQLTSDLRLFNMSKSRREFKVNMREAKMPTTTVFTVVVHDSHTHDPTLIVEGRNQRSVWDTSRRGWIRYMRSLLREYQKLVNLRCRRRRRINIWRSTLNRIGKFLHFEEAYFSAMKAVEGTQSYHTRRGMMYDRHQDQPRNWKSINDYLCAVYNRGYI